MVSIEIHWADLAAENLIKRENKKKYVCAAGITPSGTVHIGNFREAITVDLVTRALRSKGKEVRFIYSWDEYDVFRKVPKNIPEQEKLQKYLGKPIVDTPDTFGCHKSYAEHFEKEFEAVLPTAGIVPEFLYQSKKYRACEYAKEMRTAMRERKKIVTILNKFREEPLAEPWYPLAIFCGKCGDDDTEVTKYDEEYTVEYSCKKCNHKASLDFRKEGIAKLPWRVDWPMRWSYEQVDFEPGGKDHSTAGGSYDTGKQIVKEVWNREAPYYVMYDFISIKGRGGKISSSSGDVITLKDALEVYEPEIARWLFASTRPNTEFAISFDVDVINIYEEFDKCERIYFSKQQIENPALLEKEKRMYELSCVHEIPKQCPIQPSFRHLTNFLLVHEFDEQKVYQDFEAEVKTPEDKRRLKNRISCVKNWLQKYAPEEMKFTIQDHPEKRTLTPEQHTAIKQIIQILQKKRYTDEELHLEFYNIIKGNNLPTMEFFKLMYQILIKKERGPKLAGFILTIGQNRAIKILEQVL